MSALDNLSPDDAKLLVKYLEGLKERAIERVKSRNKLAQYFPDEGPYRRELYPKHIEFFAAGKKFKERLFMAANRCLTPWSPVEMDHATRRCGELIGEPGFYVRSWDGGSRCTRRASSVFLRGIEPAFRLLLDNGQFFDCSRRHRVLTVFGWAELGQLIRSSGGLHCWRTSGDCLASCGADDHPDDQLPRPGSNSVQATPPLLGGALELSRSLHSQKDAAGHRLKCIHALQDPCLPSNPYDQSLVEDLCGQFEDPFAGIDAQWKNATLRELRQFAVELIQTQPKTAAPCRSLSEHEPPWESGFRVGCNSYGVPCDLFREDQQSPFACARVLSGEGFLEALDHRQIFVPFDIPLLIGGNSVNFIIPLGLQPILDFTVEGTHNYESGGVIHHNCGKSESGAFETACHLTGKYPHWWPGRKFSKPIEAWACGTNSETTRDIVQAKLLGPVGAEGTGMIPADMIVKTTPRRSGIAGSIETVWVKHISGGTSVLGLKSYEQGRASFEGTAKDLVWDDEEPPLDCYTEMLYRTVTTRGITMITFTPLQGMSDVVKSFLEPETDEAALFKWYIQAGWSNVPHIDEEEKRALIATTPPYQLKARTEGEPALGAGAIYPIAESDITCDVFPVPDSWPRVYAMDVGWNRTAALWGARDPSTGIIYLYSEHYQGQGEPASHASAVMGRGEWIPGVIDPACQGSSQIDGRTLMGMYKRLGLHLSPAVNAVEAGISEVWQLLVSGRLKAMRNLENFFREFRKYHRNDKGSGKIVKREDHLMDCMRYLVVSGRDKMTIRPALSLGSMEIVEPSGDRAWMN